MPTPLSRSLAFCLAVLLSIAAQAAGALDLGSAQLQIAGTRLTVSPESQTVPNNTVTIVETHLEGYDVGAGALPADLRVVGDFTGPEIDGIQRLETTPNEPFRIPRLRVQGQYQLDNIRLVQGDEILAYATPRSSAVLVTQVLVARVTSRALTLDEVRSYGVVVDEDHFHAFNFTFGFAVDGKEFSYNMPVLFGGGGSLPGSVQVLRPPHLVGGGSGTSSPRFRPPRLAPFTLELEKKSHVQAYGGCKAINGCYKADPISLPGVILFPADVSLLNQFFSVVMVAKNAAPEGDPLTIRDLTAKVSLPPGLRLAETEPPTPLGVPVPVRVPGPDGELGTGDDLTFLIAQAEGQAEVLVEGKSQGTHLVEFDLEGVLDGFPDGELRRVTGTARGAVVVRDPTLGVTITHPEILRVDEEYPLRLTISNTGNAPVNLLTVSLPISGLSGTEVVGASSQTIPSLLPGESELVEFQMVSHRTGRVVATAVRHGSQIDPRFEFSVSVGELGIPLSPEAIILPDSTGNLPDDLVRHALALVGLGYSLGTAPVESLGPGNPMIDLGSLHEKVYWLGAAGRHVGLGEDLFDSAAVLAAEWAGARSPDWGWDELRRKTDKGGLVGQSLGDVFGAEAAGTTPLAAFERFAATTAYLGPVQGALAVGTNARLSIASRTSGKEVAGAGSDLTRSRDLPFADLYDLDGSELGLLGWPEEGGYRVRIDDPDGGAAQLHLLIPGPSGELRRIYWTGLSLSAGGSAEVAYQAGDTQFTLAVDADGDGIAESNLPGTETTIAPRPFAAVAAIQDANTTSGHAVEVLFTQDVDLQKLLPADPARFTIPGLVSNGGLIQAEADFCEGGLLGGCNGDLDEGENTGTGYLPGPNVINNPFEGLLNTRVVRVVFDNPVSPYKQHDLTVQDVTSLTGETISNAVLPVTTTVTDPGGIVEGTVIGPDGQPVPFARVELLQVDGSLLGCVGNKTAEVETDGAGHYELDYVRQTTCSDLFTIRATDPTTGAHGNARGRVRFVGQTAQLDVLMLGRGTVRGRVTYDDGTIPGEPQVTGYSPVFFEGLEATYGPDGTYEIRDLPVGTISLGATDRQGGYVFQTVEIERAGAVVERDLTIIRKAPDEPTGDVRGTVYEPDGTTPIYDAYVALYVDGELTGVERSDLDGTFDFGTVRAGLAEIEAFDAGTGLSGAQLFFDVQADQVNDITVLLKDDRGTVEGHVYRQTLDTVAPVAGAVVWVSGTPFNAVTDVAGYYRMEGVFSGNHSLLAADLENQVQVSETVTISADGDTVTRDLYFVESVGSGLAGEVLGFSGNPVPGAVIHLDDGHGGWWKEAHTDGAGRFSIPNLAPGGYKLYVFSGATGTVASATIRFEGETPFVHVRFKKGTIRGTTQAINESGQVVGVRSLVTYRTTVPLSTGIVALDHSAHTFETDEDGNFEIPDVLAGPYRLTVSNAFYGEKTFRDEIVFHGEVRQHDVLFEPTGEVRGVLLDWDGETPVAGATVNLRHPSFLAYDVVTDAEGRFTFSLLPPKSSRFAIDAEIEQNGVYRTARIWAAVTKPGQELDVEIVLPQQGTVSGWVEDANGAVVPGAVVTLKESAFPQRKLVHNTDADGNFSFTNVFAGPVAISAQAPQLGGLGGRDTLEIVEEGQEVFSVVVLEGTGEVTGKVISPETGEVVPTAQVALDRGVRNNFDSITTTEGEFRFRLLPLDSYRIRVFDPTTGRFGRSDWFSVDYNGQVVDVPVTLEARGSVDGHLYEPESLLGVPAATIRLSTQSIHRFTTYASTDVDGYFEFEGIPEGTFTLKTREPEGRRLASGDGEIVEEDQLVTVDLYLEQVGRVVGSVFNPVGQTAGLFANANTVLYENGQVVGASLDNPFAFDGIIADRRLEVRAYENGGDHRGSVKGTLAEGEAEITLDVEMQPIGSAAVTVLDSGGNPVSGVDVRLNNSGFYGWKSLAATSGADGRAVFDSIGVGWIGVSATQPVTLLHGSAEGALSQDGEQVELSVQLQDSGVVKGRAVLSDGVTPAVDALVVVKRGSRTLQALVDGNGDFELPSVPLGSYSLYVQESFGPGTIERFGSMDANGEIDDFGTLVLDSEQPQVVSLEPATGSADLPLGTVVTVRFSEPVDTGRWSGSWITFRKLSSYGVSFTKSWSEGDTVLTLTPNGPLASFTAYEVIVQDVIDLAGKHLADRVRTTWNTVDVVPPTVVDVVPRDGQNQIPVDAAILVTFSEEVAFASLSGSAFQLTDLSTGLGVTTTFQHLTGERQVLVTPASGLQTDRQYQLTVQGVQDNGGNVMTQAVTTAFWTVDTTPPQIVSVDFPAGTSFVSGDDVPVVVTATDMWGVVSTALEIVDWSWTDQAEPWELTGVAPVVDTATSISIVVSATDAHGNVGSAQRSIDIGPRFNATPPSVTPMCGQQGGTLIPGYENELGARTIDDEAVESIRVLVDGQEIGSAAPLNTSPAEASFLWTPPANAPAGTSYAVRFEARDFAGNVTGTGITMSTPPASAIVLEAGTSLFASTWDGTEIVLATGTFVAPDSLTLPSLVIGRGARVLSAPSESTSVSLNISGKLEVLCGGQIDVSGSGYLGGRGWSGMQPGGAPAGLVASTQDAGGSHGGAGSDGYYSVSNGGTVGEVYDSVYEPQMGGGGGAIDRTDAGDERGGDGAGWLRIDAGSLVVDGELVARGESRSDDGGGGAGGSISIHAGSIGGSGSIDVSGGTAEPVNSTTIDGPGGGGRVALWVDALGSFDPVTQVKAWGGSRIYVLVNPDQILGYGAPGTIYVKESADTYGRLIIDSGTAADGSDRQAPATELPALGEGAVASFEVSGSDAWVSGTEAFRPRWVGTWMSLLDGAGADLGTYRVAEIDATGRMRLEGAGAVSGSTAYRGEYRFDQVETKHGAGLSASDQVTSSTVVFEGQVAANAEVAAESVVVKSGAVVRPSTGSSIHFAVTGTMTVEAGATIDVSGLGYLGGRGWSGMQPGGAPAGLVASTQDAGGSHGGAGSDGYYSVSNGGTVGEVYDSVYEPQMGGGGGAIDRTDAGDERGGDGAGWLRIDAGSLVVDGELVARGESRSDDGGGGAGGSISIHAGSIGGSGSIDVSGGTAEPVNSTTIDGPGGGGRVALWVDALGSFDPVTQVKAWGGSRIYVLVNPDQILGYGAPGTIYVKESADTYGRLIIDQGGGNGSPVATTALPAIGKGFVGAVSVDTQDATDLWVEDQDPIKVFSLGVVGMWVRIGGVDYPVIGQSADRRQLLLDGAAGSVATGDAYLGIYKFDSVTVTGNANLELRDGEEVGVWTVDPGSTATHFDIDPPTVSVTSPAAGSLLTSGDPVVISATASDPTGVVAVEFTFGNQSFVDDTAPYEWSTSVPVVSTEQDMAIVVAATDGNANTGSLNHVVRVQPPGPGDYPVVTISCPSPGARLAPGTGLDFSVSASHEDGIDLIDLLVDDDPTVVDTVSGSSGTFHFDVPLDSLEGDVHTLHFRARKTGGVYAEALYPVEVIAANVITQDTTLAAADTSFDGSSVVVSGGTLAVEGPHTFRDMVVLDGARLTHPASTSATVERLDLSLTRDLFVSCGGSIDVSDRGYPGGVSYRTAGPDAFYMADEFRDGDLVGWQFVDEGEVAGPSNWFSLSDSVGQASSIHSVVEPGKGTYALWSGGLSTGDYRFGVFFRSLDDGAVGAMFRYVDADNYYRFTWDKQLSSRRLERVFNGVVTVLAEDSAVYAYNTWTFVEVVADGSNLEVLIDGTQIFSVTDSALTAGTIALYTCDNAEAYFSDAQVSPPTRASIFAGGSHGGRGGGADGTNVAYGSIFDPRDPGAGGGEFRASHGGGVIRVSAAGQAVIDGSIVASGRGDFSLRSSSAGGAIRLDGAVIKGTGTIDASGGDALIPYAAGGGGRIALYGGTIDEGLIARTLAAGGDADTAEHRGAAGTIFVKRDTQALGDLILDNGGLDSAQSTELLSAGPGTVSAVDATSITDDQATFTHDLSGLEIFFNGLQTALWPITGHADLGQTLTLDTSTQALTAQVGDTYEGLYRFDRVIVRGGAQVVTRSPVQSPAPEVEAGSSWLSEVQPSVTITAPLDGQSFVAGDLLTISASVDSAFGVDSVRFELGDTTHLDWSPPFEWTTSVPEVSSATGVPVRAVALDQSGHESQQEITIQVSPPAPVDPPAIAITCPSPGARLAPGTGLDFLVSATHTDGIDRVELQVGTDPTPIASDSTAPYDLRFVVPAYAVEGDTYSLHFVARSTSGAQGEALYPVEVIAANVITQDTTLAAADTSFDGSSVVVSGGTLAVEGPHTFRDMVVLDGARLTHPASTSATVERLDLSLTRDLFVSCGGSIDVSDRGYPGGVSYRTAGPDAFYMADEFRDGDLVGWQFVDEGEVAGPSNWFSLSDSVGQASSIHSVVEPGKGTYALWSGGLSTGDYRFGVFFRSLDDGAVGAMFRYVDADNYYRFTWDKQLSSRRLERVFNGVVTVLAEDSAVYAYNTWTFVEVVADGSNLEVLIDGTQIFSVTDSALTAGTIALYTCDNAEAYFSDAQVSPPTRASIFAGGSHGGRGGGADGTNVAYGSIFDPRDPGAGGGEFRASHGGGVIRVSAAGQAVIDGSIVASGRGDFSLRSSSAGGAIRLDGAVIKGTGTIDASGGDALIPYAAGGGGRIALYGGTIDEGLIARTLAAGGDADTAEHRGAAGTIFVKRDTQALGDLILDNGGLDSAQSTELLSAGPGTVSAVDATSITDDQATFTHDLSGLEIFFNGLQTALWPITGHADLGQTLTLDTSTQALTAQVGDTYEGLYRFDRVIVRGGAQVVTRSPVQSPAPEVEAGSSWLSEVQPSVTITAPLDGQAVRAGDLLTISASVDSAFGAGSVRFELDGVGFVDRSAPFEWTTRARPVATVTSKAITVVAIDRAGNELRDDITIQVEPGLDSVAPTLSRAPCPRSGDLVLGGLGLRFDFSAVDESLLYRHTLSVDGGLVDEVRWVDSTSASRSVSWTPPASALPGTVFTVQIEAEDYGGNVTTEVLTLSIPTAGLLVGDQDLTAGLDGTDIVLGPGTFTAVDPLSPASLTLLDGATLVPAGGSSLQLDVATGMRVQCGGAVDAFKAGYPGTAARDSSGFAPSWVAPSTPISGGSHGGFGTAWSDSYGGVAGETFDSVYMPGLGGGSGALGPNTSRSGAGGGIVEIRAGSMLLDGEIRAMGEVRSGYSDSSGGGGSVFIAATSMAGTGTVDASGGDYTVHWGGGAGGGGRVALHVDTFQGFDPSAQVFARGGVVNGTNPTQYAGAGTIYVKELGSTYGRLIVDNGTATDGTSRVGPATELPALGNGAVSLFEVSGSDAWVTAASPFYPRWLGAWMVLEDGTGAALGAFEVVEIDTSGRARLAGASGVSGAASYGGEYRFDALEIRNGSGLAGGTEVQGGDVVLAGQVEVPEVLTASSVLLQAGTIATPAGQGIDWTISGAVTFETGSLLDVSATGYPGVSTQVTSGTAPSWVSPSTPISGGSHGGFGTAWSDSYGGVAGATFDSVYMPGLGGGSGALGPNTSRSGAGGGVVEIHAGSILLDGEIRTKGEVRTGYSDSSGGGGSVFIAAASMAGTGTVDASGGDYTVHWGGGAGGGGRVALHVDTFQGFDPSTQVFARGGTVNGTNPTKYAGAGTIYVKELGSTYGRLIVDNGAETDGTSRVGPATELPALGSGTVSLFEVSGSDAWVTASSPFYPRWLGGWMVLEDGSGADLGAFEVVEIDGSGRARLAGAAGVSGSASYRGEYRFDALEYGDGSLLSTDSVELGSISVASTAGFPSDVVVAGDVSLAPGSVATLSEGDTLHLQMGGVLSIGAGAVLDLTGQGFAGGTSAHSDGYAPPVVLGAGVEYGGSHGGRGDYWDVVSNLPGEVYDSVYTPLLAGGGGALDQDGSGSGLSGGGSLDLDASSVILDGEIRANGGSSDDKGNPAGGGGTVFIEASSLSGSGIIAADGGFARSCSYKRNVGAGGGGRIGLWVNDLTGFDVASQVHALGGTFYSCSWGVYRCAASGTVFVRGLSSSSGDLYVTHPSECAGTSVIYTTLPTIGTGTVGVADPDTDDPTDLWIEPQDQAALFSLGTVGMSVRVSGVDYLVIDQSVDRRRLLLDGAAGAVGVGDTYEGVYTFDTVTVRGGAVLEFLDTADVTTYDVDADSQVITPQ